MKRLEVRPLARADIADIRRYTLDHWGLDQAERYVRDIDALLIALASGESRGMKYGARHRRIRCGSHQIYFRQGRDVITVVRVLHSRMDALSRLGDP